MRAYLLLVGLAAISAPAAAEPAAAVNLPPELTDPATADRIARSMDGVTNALLDMKVGEVQAAVEGRKPTQAERNLTIRDIERRKDPNFDRNLHRQIAEAGPKIAQGMKAVSDALPAMMKALDEASRAIDRAAANMPDPTYPKR